MGVYTFFTQFFKIQFREFRRGGVRSEWRTLDDVINARSRSFEVQKFFYFLV